MVGREAIDTGFKVFQSIDVEVFLERLGECSINGRGADALLVFGDLEVVQTGSNLKDFAAAAEICCNRSVQHSPLC